MILLDFMANVKVTSVRDYWLNEFMYWKKLGLYGTLRSKETPLWMCEGNICKPKLFDPKLGPNPLCHLDTIILMEALRNLLKFSTLPIRLRHVRTCEGMFDIE